MSDKRDTARVIAPPPLIAVGVVLLGLALDKLSPVGLAGAVFPRSARFAIATRADCVRRMADDARAAALPASPARRPSRGSRHRRSSSAASTSARAIRCIRRSACSRSGLRSRSPPTGSSCCCPIGALVIHFGVVRREERYLAAKFGDDYRALLREGAALWLADLSNFPVAISSPR